MSILSRYDSEGIVPIMDEFQGYIDDAPDILRLQDKTIEKANVEQAYHQHFYEEKKAEAHTLLKYVEQKADERKSQLWRSYTENFDLDLSYKDKEQYIKSEEKYLEANEVFLIVQELYKKFEGISEAFKSRGFALRNVTNLRVNNLDNTTL